MTTSMTDAIAELQLLPLARAIAEALPAEARRRPPSEYVLCKGCLRLEGDWGVVNLGDIVPRSHPAVAEHPDLFVATSAGTGIAPVDWARMIKDPVQRELELRRLRVDELFKTRPSSRPQAGRVGLAPTITPAPPPPTSARATSYPWTITLSPEPTRRYTIRLLDSVASRIMSEARLSQGLETGGYLWSWERPGRHSASVVWANGAGADSRHGSSRMSLATEDAVRSELMPEWLDPDGKLHLVGDHHSHPNGTTNPSQADLDAWASHLWNRPRLSEFVSMILGHGRASGRASRATSPGGSPKTASSASQPTSTTRSTTGRPERRSQMANRTAYDQVVVAKEAVVIEVGAVARQWGRIEVKDRRSGLMVEIDDTDREPVVEEQPGRVYTFREGQRVRRDHEAVKECPNAFRDIDATDEIIYGLPTDTSAATDSGPSKR